MGCANYVRQKRFENWRMIELRNKALHRYANPMRGLAMVSADIDAEDEE